MGPIYTILPRGHWILPGLIVLTAGLGTGLVWLWLRRRNAANGGRPEARRQWSRRLADASFDGLLIHRNGMILQMNTALVRLLGYREVELLGTPFFSLTHPALVALLRTELEAPRPEVTRFTLLHADESERFVEMASHTLEFKGFPATVTAIRNITRLRELEDRLEDATHNDALTSLPNRQQFTKALHEAIIANDRGGGTTAVLALEVDQLKAINEVFGRSGGDSLLRQISLRLTGFRHDKDIVGRLDGDKFGIIQPHAGAPNRNTSLVSQIEQSFEEPFIIDGRSISASMSIGMAIYPEHATDADGLLWAASLAMRRVTQAGGGGSRMFSHADAQAAGPPKTVAQANTSRPNAGNAVTNFRGTMRSNQRLAQEMSLGISRGEVTLEYQPYFAAKSLSLAGFEAAGHWRHPKEGQMTPEQLVAVADAAGLSEMLGNAILEAACVEAVRCKSPMMSVNLSPLQFQDIDLPLRVAEILRKTMLPPERLEFGITEAMLTGQPYQKLFALREIGVRVALDDFGTGISTLTSLAGFPFNKIKVEKRLIQALGTDPNAGPVLGAILALARNFRIEVAAEGVETEAQLAYLQENGCQFVQGQYLGQPAAQAMGFQAGPQAGYGSASKPSLVASQSAIG